jgi:hypothetical protein
VLEGPAAEEAEPEPEHAEEAEPAVVLTKSDKREEPDEG